jgi:uncharacterized protein YukE
MAKKSKSSVDVDVNVKGKGVKKTQLEMKKLGQQTDKTSKSTGTLNRNWKGASKQSSGASKNFSKLSQGMGGIVGAYAMLAANIFAIGAAFRFLQSAGDLQKLKEGQVLYASATGVALKSLTNDIIAATDAQITFTNAAQSAAIGKAAGMSNDQLIALGKGAKDVSIILGRDVTDAFNRLVRGVTKAEPELLDELGIILRLADASEKYGASIGKTADQLTQYEKSQAVTLEVLDQLESKYGRIMAVMAPSGNPFTKLGKAFDDIVNQVKVFASFVVGPIADTLTRMPYLIVGLLIAMANQLVKTGLASWATNAKVKAKELAMGYQEAQARLEDLQRTQAKRAAALKDVNVRGKGLKAPVTKGKIAEPAFAQVAAGQGDKLNAIQIKSMRGVLDRNKTMLASLRQQWYQLLTDVEMKNKSTTMSIKYMWNATGAYLKMGWAGLVSAWNGTMAMIKGAAAATGAFIAKALGMIAMVSMLVTLGISAYQWFKNAGKAKSATEDLVDEMAIASEKVKGLNEEFEKFNLVQKIIVEDGQGFLQFFEAMGNRIGQLSISMSKAMFEGVAEGFKEGLGKTDKDIEEIMNSMAKRASAWTPWLDMGGEDFASLDIHRDTLLDTIAHMETGANTFKDGYVMIIAGTKEWEAELAKTKETLANVNAEMKRSELAAKAYRGNLIAYMEGGFGGEDYTEFGKYLQNQLDATKIASAAFGNAKNPVMTYLNVLRELTALTPEMVGTPIWDELIDKLMAAQSASVGFSTAIANAGRMAKDNIQETNKLLMDLQKRSTQGKLADTLRLEVGQRDIAAEEGIGGAPSGMQGPELASWVKRGQEIERHIILFDHLDQMKDDAKKRTLETTLLEKKSLIGITKLLGKRIKMQMSQLKNANKIADVDDQILAIQLKIADTGKAEKQQIRMLENALLQKDILVEQNLELERKLNYHMQINDAAKQEFESGLQKTFAAFMKGEESSFKDAMRAMFESIWDAVANTISKQLTEMVMGAFGFKTSAQKMKEAIEEAAITHARLVKEAIEMGTGAKDRQEAKVTAKVDEISHVRDAEYAVSQYDPEGEYAAEAEALAVIKALEAEAQQEKVAFIEAEAARHRANEKVRIDALIEEGEHLKRVRELRKQAGLGPSRGMPNAIQRVPYTPPDLSSLDPELRSKIEEFTSLSRFSDRTNPVPVVMSNPDVGVLRTVRASEINESRNYPGDVDRSTLIGTVMPAWLQPGEMDPREVGDIPLEKAFYEAGLKKDSIYVHDTHVVSALYELLGDGGALTKALPRETGNYIQEVEEDKPSWGDTLFGVDREKINPLMSGKKAPGSVDAFGNPIGAPVKGGMFAGIIDPFKKLFTDDSPWMTKLGDFFGGEGSFLSGLGGIFGGLGDMLGGLLGGGTGGGLGGILATLFTGADGGIAIGGFRKFARGGIATSPTLGLIGEGRYNEAVVPLPNGKAIPVDMRSNAQNNNITVNVSSDGQTTTSGADNEGLGQAIAKAVQEELQNQKRAGGILNRYGTA